MAPFEHFVLKLNVAFVGGKLLTSGDTWVEYEPFLGMCAKSAENWILCDQHGVGRFSEFLISRKANQPCRILLKWSASKVLSLEMDRAEPDRRKVAQFEPVASDL